MPRGSLPALALAIALALLLGHQQGSNGWIWLLGWAIGWLLVRGGFGFSGPIRRALNDKEWEVLAPLAALLLLLVLGSGLLFWLAEQAGLDLRPSRAPLSLTLAIGAFLFGIGMQVARRCASGTLASAAQPDGAFGVTLMGLAVGVFIGSLQRPHLEKLIPGAWPPVVLVERLPLALAVLSQLAILLVLLLAVVALFRFQPPARRLPHPAHPPRDLGTAPTVIGLSLLLLLVFAVSGEPWKVLWGLGLSSAHLAKAAGWDPQGSLFWGSSTRMQLLTSPWLQQEAVVVNLGVIFGAWTAGKLRDPEQPSVIHRKSLSQSWLRHGIGGLLMGYGGFLSYGCNISSFLGGVMSFSLHGWLWLIAAVAGSAFWLSCERLIGRNERANGIDPPSTTI
ncbi:MAG: YeeE/YedE thiosulfate transporter family protein [Cyanobacteriota bacterium]|nr:YeeE/YedE thiosulfate transporter family protein [Cyanobacteriota bacterium]